MTVRRADGSDPLGQEAARRLLARSPKIVRHTKAWVDDSELCLRVECRLDDGGLEEFEMNYSWDCEPFRCTKYMHDVAVWALNGEWDVFLGFVQERFSAELAAQASDDYYAEYD